MKIIYELNETAERTLLVQHQIKEGNSAFRTKWGLYGTSEWWENLKKDNLIKSIDGKISKIYYSGHNDFPEFEMTNGSIKYNFERLGDVKLYETGLRILVECIESKYILPQSGSEETLVPLKITIL